METFYNWLKERKNQGNGDRRVTLIYDDFILKTKKACIKPKPYGYSGHYMATIPDEKKPDYYEINYLLCFIEEEFLRDYYVTCEGMVTDPYSDEYRVAYKLTVSDKIHVKPSNSHYGIHPLAIDPIDPILVDDCFSLMKELSRIVLDGVWDSKKRLEIEKVTLNGPATVIFWKDGTKTVVKCDKDDALDYEKGILYAALKKLCNKKEYNDILRLVDAWSEYNTLYPDLFSDTVEVDEKPETKKREPKYQKCPVCGNGYNLNYLRMRKLYSQKFVDIRCSKCDTLFRVKGNPLTTTKWWTKLEHEVLARGNQEPTNQCGTDTVEVEKPKKAKKVYKRKFGDSDQNCPNCGQNWIWSNNRRLSFFRDGFINITCKNCGHKFRYVKGGRYESQ